LGIDDWKLVIGDWELMIGDWELVREICADFTQEI
jgi:hypothetical protein